MYRHCPIIVACIGFVVLAIGVLCTWYAFPKLIQSQIDENIALKDGSQTYEVWQKQPFPLFYKVYFFNVSNPAEVMKGEKAIVREVGPYVYDLNIERKVIAVSEKTDTIKYHLKKNYVFNATASGCRSDEDTVTIINMALMGTLLKVNSIMPSLVSMIADALPYLYPGIFDIFLRAPVKNLLFDGITIHCSAAEIEHICPMMKAALPKNMKVAANDRDFIFSMIGVFNNTLMGPFNMTRGLKNTTRGELVEYEEHTVMDTWYDGGVCNMINGSDSGLFFPMKNPADTIYTFVPEICRSVGVDFDKKMVQNDLNVYRYASTKNALSHEGPNRCFCEDIGDDDGECPVEGTLDLEPCLRAPVLMSNPHFYLGDAGLLDYVGGLKPDQHRHESYLVIEPKTATPIEGVKRTQMNTEVKHFSEIDLLQNISDGVFPILWLEEGVNLPDDFMQLLASSFAKIAILDIVKWVLIITGMVLMCAAFALLMYQERLMCFSNKVTVTLNEPRGVFTTRNSSLPFNTTVVYPKDVAPNRVEDENDNESSRNNQNWPVDQRFQ